MAKLSSQEVVRREGNPAGTHFAVITLIVLLVIVGIYAVAVQVYSVKDSPAFAPSTVNLENPIRDPAHSTSQNE